MATADRTMLWPLPITSSSNFVISSASHKVMSMFTAQKASAITHIGVLVTAVTGGPTGDARLESVTAGSPPVPSGSLAAANTNKTFTPSAGTFTWHALTSSYTPALGETLAAVIASDGAATSFTVLNRPGWDSNWQMPFGGENSGAGWVQRLEPPAIAIKYTDGEIQEGIIPYGAAVGDTSYDSGTNPNERGVEWTQPYTATCMGAYLNLRADAATSDGDLILYDSGTTVLASTSVEGDKHFASNAAANRIFIPLARTTLTAGNVYHLAFKPSTTNDYRMRTLTFADADSVLGTLGHDVRGATRNGGSWTYSDTALACISPKILDVTLSSGSNGGLIY